MEVRFVIPGPPKGKGRPRFSQVAGHAKATTPKDTVLYENLVRTEYQRQCGEARFEDGSMLDLRVVAYYPIPSSKSKKQQRLMEAGVIRPTTKPDNDNILKIIADSLNQIAYKDDAQVVDTQVRKFYSRRPRVAVVIRSAAATESNTALSTLSATKTGFPLALPKSNTTPTARHTLRFCITPTARRDTFLRRSG